jgi:hypothetical protein
MKSLTELHITINQNLKKQYASSRVVYYNANGAMVFRTIIFLQ